MNVLAARQIQGLDSHEMLNYLIFMMSMSNVYRRMYNTARIYYVHPKRAPRYRSWCYRVIVSVANVVVRPSEHSRHYKRS